MFRRLHRAVDALFSAGTVSNLIVRVGQNGTVLYDLFRSSEERTLNEHTLFDMASVTKIVATTSLFLLALDRGEIHPCDPVGKYLPVPKDKEGLTLFHLLTHTIGSGHKSMLGCKGGYAEIAEYILSIPCDIPIGSDVRYSCPAFILLGRILEGVYGMGLSDAFERYVAAPLGLSESHFLPDRSLDIVNSNRIAENCGLVNDYNCRYLGGVCGNAGLFSSLRDMTRYVEMLLRSGEPLVSRETFALATKNHTPGMSESRGLGFLCVDERYTQAGGLFSASAFGHCGHTGQSVFFDPKNGLYVIVLSDATVSTIHKYGKENYGEVIRMRGDLHAAIRADLFENSEL
ncbi:MAG: beta-lactamase family protein [Clostridia bacterium]|nr:beta-lactamase family protein [Clostridia bacterium]